MDTAAKKASVKESMKKVLPEMKTTMPIPNKYKTFPLPARTKMRLKPPMKKKESPRFGKKYYA